MAALLAESPAAAVPPPDLAPTAVTASPAVIVAGGRIHFDSGVRNRRATGTGVFNIKWYVDGQEVDAYGSHRGVPGRATVLNGNSQFDWIFASPGRHTVAFAVDVDNHVAETNEANNIRVIRIVVRRPNAGQVQVGIRYVLSIYDSLPPAQRIDLADLIVDLGECRRSPAAALGPACWSYLADAIGFIQPGEVE